MSIGDPKPKQKRKTFIPDDARCDRCGDEKVVWRWRQLWCVECDAERVFGDDAEDGEEGGMA